MASIFDSVEVVKENYAPLKTGRVLSGLTSRPVEKQSWESRIADSEDPLGVWKEFVRRPLSRNLPLLGYP